MTTEYGETTFLLFSSLRVAKKRKTSFLREHEREGIGMKILLVNDDGIREPGFVELARRLSERHQVTAVAPDGNRSAVSHGEKATVSCA